MALLRAHVIAERDSSPRPLYDFELHTNKVTRPAFDERRKMNATPKKAVHWRNNDISLSEICSPSFSFNGSMEESMASTPSLEYINSQLVAHGFVPSPGLLLDGVSNSDQQCVIKCLFGLLNQRVVSLCVRMQHFHFSNHHFRKTCPEQRN